MTSSPPYWCSKTTELRPMLVSQTSLVGVEPSNTKRKSVSHSLSLLLLSLLSLLVFGSRPRYERNLFNAARIMHRKK